MFDQAITKHYKPLLDLLGDSDTKYDMWDTIIVPKRRTTEANMTNTDKETATTSRVLSRVSRQSTVSGLICDLQNKVSIKLSGHLFRAKLQQKQFKLARETMKPRSAVLVMDFSKNYTCALQDEVQSYR